MKYYRVLCLIGHGIVFLPSASYSMVKESHSEALFKALSEEDMAACESLIAAGTSLKVTRSNDGATPLIVAAGKGNVPLCKLLIKSGAPIDVCDNLGHSAIFTACNRNYEDIVALFLAHRANPYVKLHLSDDNDDNNGTRESGDYSLAGWICEKGLSSRLLDLVLTSYPKLADQKVGGYTPLHLAARSGNAILCEKLLTAYRVSITQKTNNLGVTALGYATAKGDVDVCRVLISAGADPQKEDHFVVPRDKVARLHPFLFACSQGHFSVCELLVSYNPQLMLLKKADKKSFIDIAMEKNHDIRFCDLYCKYTNIARNCSKAALYVLSKAVRYGYVKYLEQYVKNGGDLTIAILPDDTSDLCASIAEHVYLGNGSENSFKTHHQPLLIAAAKAEQVTMCRWLLERGAHKKENILNQALYAAARRNNIVLCRLFLEYGADINCFDGEMLTESPYEACNFLIESGAKVFPKIFRVRPMPQSFFETLCSALLKRATVANLNHIFQEKWREGDVYAPTFLTAFIAEAFSLSSILPHTPVSPADQVLLENLGFCDDYDYYDDDYAPARKVTVKMVTRQNYYEKIRLLLRAGADPNLSDSSKTTPLMLACKFDDTYLAQLLIDHGAHLDVQDNQGRTAVHWALSAKSTECLELLVAKKATLEKADQKGYRPLHHAIRTGNIPQIKILLQARADYTAPTSGVQHFTTAELIAGQGNKEIEALFKNLTKMPAIVIPQKSSVYLKLAKEDLEYARYLKQQKDQDPNAPIKKSNIVLHIAYCAEKALKAFLVNQEDSNAELLHSHKLDELLAACIVFDKSFNVLTDFTMQEYKELSYYATGKKYQEEKGRDKKYNINRAFELAERVLNHCNKIFAEGVQPIAKVSEIKVPVTKVRVIPIAYDPQTNELLFLLGREQNGFYGDFNKNIQNETVEQTLSKILNLQTNFKVNVDHNSPKNLVFVQDGGQSLHFIKVKFVPQEELNQGAVTTFKSGYAWIPASSILKADKKLTYLGKYSILNKVFMYLKKYLPEVNK
jgi:ankyrin repeat protein